MVSMGAKSKRYPLIPEEEQKCVWMTTGLISYKLCDRDFQCDICPFDQAVRNSRTEEDFEESLDGGAEGPHQAEPSGLVHGAVFYHSDHCWAKVERADRVRIGIDDLLSRLISRVKVVILPQAGSFAGQGECFAHIIQEDYILPVISPLCGSVEEVNPRLEKEPGLVAGDPCGEGWLITVKPRNLESDLKHLLFGRKARLWYRREEKEIMARAGSILRRHPREVGPTMQDGGEPIARLEDLLGGISAGQRTWLLDFSVAGRQKKRRPRPN